MFIERIENKKIRHLDELLNKNIKDWQAAKTFIESYDAQYSREFGLIAVVRHAGGGPWTSRYEHCHNVLVDSDTFERMVVIADKYNQRWLSSYTLKEKGLKIKESEVLIEYLFKDCSESCLHGESHYYALAPGLAGGFYNAKKIDKEIAFRKKMKLESALS